MIEGHSEAGSRLDDSHIFSQAVGDTEADVTLLHTARLREAEELAQPREVRVRTRTKSGCFGFKPGVLSVTLHPLRGGS